MTKASTDATAISSWERWETLFGEAGYATVAPGWQGVAETALNFVSRFQPTTGES